MGVFTGIFGFKPSPNESVRYISVKMHKNMPKINGETLFPKLFSGYAPVSFLLYTRKNAKNVQNHWCDRRYQCATSKILCEYISIHPLRTLMESLAQK